MSGGCESPTGSGACERMPSGCRVLVLNERDPHHPSAGGAEIHVAEIFGRLAAQGLEVTLATSSFPGSLPRERLDGLDVWRLGRLPTYYPRVAWTCARETRRGHYDVVVECLNKVPFYSPVYSAVPVLALCHHLFGEVAFLQVAWPIAATVWTAERLIPALYRRLPFVTISESSRQDLIARGIPAERIHVIHCGIERRALEANTHQPRRQRVGRGVDDEADVVHGARLLEVLLEIDELVEPHAHEGDDDDVRLGLGGDPGDQPVPLARPIC